MALINGLLQFLEPKWLKILHKGSYKIILLSEKGTRQSFVIKQTKIQQDNKDSFLTHSKLLYFTYYFKLCKSIHSPRVAMNSLQCFGYLLESVFMISIPYSVLCPLEVRGAGGRETWVLPCLNHFCILILMCS